MFIYAIFAAALAAGAPAGGSETASPDAGRCAALVAERQKLKDRVGAARARKAGGFVAGLAGRALLYAPGLDVGDSRLARLAGQEAESALHNQARSGLDKVQSTGRSADASADKVRLDAVETELDQLSCPKA